jgi:hypothetical protein
MSVKKTKLFRWGLAVLLLLFFGTLLYGPTSAEIRIDTGDLRYRYLGIPLEYKNMPEPERSLLLELAKKSNVLDGSWHECAKYPLPTTNNTDTMCRLFYHRVATWVQVDPQLALFLAEDVARYIQQTKARHGGPKGSYLLLWLMENDDDGSDVVKDGWQDDEEVQAYLQSVGYTPSK